ncbi:MAG: hypothetical protein U0176_03925 [Bacteroidia bacterium]
MRIPRFPDFKTAILSFVLLLGGLSLSAQDSIPVPDPMDDGRPKRVSGGMGYGQVGLGIKDLSGLDAVIGNGVNFNDKSLTVGGGGFLMIRSIMLGGEGMSYWNQAASFGNQEVKYESGFGQFFTGYVVYGRKGLLVYPKVGIGGYKESLTFVNKDAVTNMDTILTGAYTSTTLTHKGTMMSFGAGLEWMLGFDESSGSGITLGFDLGYRLGVGYKGWESATQAITGNTPKLSPTGMYANFHIGFSGWNRQ